jgi:hypothetical protein
MEFLANIRHTGGFNGGNSMNVTPKEGTPMKFTEPCLECTLLNRRESMSEVYTVVTCMSDCRRGLGW